MTSLPEISAELATYFSLAAETLGVAMVAALAASGRSNKAIAQELFVTTKTVEIHLSNTYRKLGVASRGDLAGLIVVDG